MTTFNGILFHGSGYKFDNFDGKKARIADDLWGGGLCYTTENKTVAITYAKSMSKTAKTGTPFVYQVRVSLAKIFDVDDEFTGKELTDILPKTRKALSDFARAAGMMGISANEPDVIYKLETGNITLTGAEIFKGLSKGMTKTAEARNLLISKGYDGLRYNGGVQMSQAIKHNVYIVYNASSIKIEKRFVVVTSLVNKQ